MEDTEGSEPTATQREPAAASSEKEAATQAAAQDAQREPAATPTEQAPQQGAPAGSTVNIHKYQRDLAKAEAERDAVKAGADGYKALKAEFDEWKAQQEAAPCLFASSDKSTGGSQKGTPDPRRRADREHARLTGLDTEK